MITLLARLFIKDWRNYDAPQVRRRYGVLCAVVAIVLNLSMVVAKWLSASWANSASIRADAINNLSDVCSGLLLALAFHLSGMKPQPHRPFGHGRIEYLAGFGVGVLILLLGAELIKASVTHILHPQELVFSWWAAATLLASIALKCYMGHFMLDTSRKVHSSALYSTGMDSLSDTLSTAAVLMGLILFKWFPNSMNLDGWLELVVALIIVKAGIDAVKTPLLQLLGTTPDPELVKKVEKICLSHPEVVGIHDLVVHDYGPGRLHISVHCEVPGNEDIYKLHEVLTEAMEQMDEELGCISVIHMDPLHTDDKHVAKMRDELGAALAVLGHDVRVHDFRVVPGPTRSNVIFDCVVPYDVEEDAAKAKARIVSIVKELWPDTDAIVQIDRPYIFCDKSE